MAGFNGFNPYALGAKVYGGGSSFAHRGGGLDPMGYINRELNRGLGGEDSDQRSGHASAALAKLASKGFGTGGQRYRPGTINGKKKRKKGKGKLRNRGGVVTGNENAPGQSDELDSDNLTSISTPVISSSTGKLSLDPMLMQDKTDIEYEYNNRNIELDAQAAQAESDYLMGKRDLTTQQTQDQRSDLNRFSARGMAYSSGYGNEVNDSATMFQRAFSDLDTQKANIIAEIGKYRGQNTLWKDAALKNLADRQAALNAENAGSLGLDPSHVDPAGNPMPKPSPQAKYSVPASRWVPGHGKAAAAAAAARNKKKRKKKGQGK